MSSAAATTQQLLPSGHPLLGAAAWSKYHLAVTVHKDDEASSVATRLDGYHPETPAVSLDSFIDGERQSLLPVCLTMSPGVPRNPSGRLLFLGLGQAHHQSDSLAAA